MNKDFSDKPLRINIPFEDWNLISIYTEPKDMLFDTTVDDMIVEDAGFVTVFFNGAAEKLGCRDILSTMFGDVDERVYEENKDKPKYKDKLFLFSEDQAKDIIKFIDKIQEEEDETVLVLHCDAGISRSGAVATFVCDYIGFDYQTFKRENPGLQPNIHVLSKLRSVSGMNPYGA
jgi:hypothetical protein